MSERTARHTLRALAAALLMLAASGAARAQVSAAELAPDAPTEYTVVRGDTLWDISGKFLKSPWKWPKIWKINADRIKDPHWIYPGDRIFLIGDGQGNYSLAMGRRVGDREAPEERVAPRVRDEGPAISNGRSALSTIPAELIRTFVNRPMLVPTADLATLPTIVASEEGRMNLGTGNRAYVEGIQDAPGTRLAIWRPGLPIVDPETGETLAVEAIDLGVAEVTRSGTPATVLLRSSRQEVATGDRLAALNEDRVFSYVPSSPPEGFSGRLIRVHDDRPGALAVAGERSRQYLAEGGARSVILINRGTRHGVLPGNVVSMSRPGGEIENRGSFGWKLGERMRPPMQLPTETYGRALVFKVFDRLSYAFVLSSSRPVKAGDTVGSPD